MPEIISTKEICKASNSAAQSAWQCGDGNCFVPDPVPVPTTPAPQK
ncbi:MAG: hypothetical protein M0P92_04635 [Acholeplasmataceae bacterium]|jgi:hypothetical protein|nr:hypothetical protein [Acholeplasmataceae bacterium]